MITLMEMLKDKKVDPAHGRPLDMTRIYMANVMSSGEAVLLAKKQKLAEARARRKQKADLYEDIAELARGKEPSWRYAKSVPTAAGQLGQQAIGFPPLGSGNGADGEAPGAKNT
jgi:hypothetical protein